MSSPSTLTLDAHAVFLPAIDTGVLPDHIAAHLDRGGTSVLVGESRSEYVARQMSAARVQRESRESFSELTADIVRHGGPETLIAVDQELVGIQRLHGLVRPLPTLDVDRPTDEALVEQAAQDLAEDCEALGVNVVLAPIIDVVSGPNLWLAGRTMSSDAASVSRAGAAFVRGLQARGGVAATAKHFPGHPVVEGDPAVDADSEVGVGSADLAPGLNAFRAAIRAGVRVVMVGPTLVPALDAELAASRSPRIVEMLRADLGHDGVVLSDDLDGPGILRGDSIGDAVVDALTAGVDWLLVAGSPRLPGLVTTVVEAVHDGRLPIERLANAAASVRLLGEDLRTTR